MSESGKGAARDDDSRAPADGRQGPGTPDGSGPSDWNGHGHG